MGRRDVLTIPSLRVRQTKWRRFCCGRVYGNVRRRFGEGFGEDSENKDKKRMHDEGVD
jgi:hypothetical protein